MFRIGMGYDLHRLDSGRRLVLGGIEIPFEKGLIGHSDADVLAHALTDALLGATAQGDIGQHFPDMSEKYRDADSMELLGTVVTLIADTGYQVANVDCTIVAEAPRLSEHIGAIRRSLAACLGVKSGAVSVKAKTNEGVGPEGTGEAISAQAVVLLESI